MQDHLYGGLRDGPIPNYIYRWTGREAAKCVAAYHPERQFEVRAHPYWDFYVNEYEIRTAKSPAWRRWRGRWEQTTWSVCSIWDRPS